jgi:hypothetical protein
MTNKALNSSHAQDAASATCCCLSNSRHTRSSRLDHALQLRYRGNRPLGDAPIVHIQAPCDKVRADDTLAGEKIGAIQCGITMWPRDRDTAHHNLDEVLRIFGEVRTRRRPEWSE